MEPGFYWYYGAPDDGPDFCENEWQTVEVYFTYGGTDQTDLLVSTCGSEISYSLSKLHGRFVGPIAPPS